MSSTVQSLPEPSTRVGFTDPLAARPPAAGMPSPEPRVRSLLQESTPVSGDACGALVITDTADLAEAVSGLGAAAGAPLDVLAVPAAARAALSRYRLVLVGEDVLAAATEPAHAVKASVSRHASAAVLCRREPDQALWRAALAVGAREVITLPDQEARLLDHFLDLSAHQPKAMVLAVTGGRGGAGASTLAVAMAVTGAQDGLRPVLVDVDVLGGGLDLVLGAERDCGLRWADLRSVRGRMQPGLLTRSLPVAEGVRLLSWSRQDDADVTGETFCAVLDAATRESDLVILDLPRHVPDAARPALRSCSTALIVVPAEVRAAAAAARVAAVLEPLIDDVQLVVRGPAPTGLTADAIAAALGLPLAGELRPEPGLAVALDQGVAPPLRARGPLAVFCRRYTSAITPSTAA